MNLKIIKEYKTKLKQLQINQRKLKFIALKKLASKLQNPLTLIESSEIEKLIRQGKTKHDERIELYG